MKHFLIGLLVYLMVEPTKSEVLEYYINPQSEQVAILEDPMRAFLARSDLIQNAKKEILICWYHLEDDTNGMFLISQLIAAARRGVKVGLIVDDLFLNIKPKYLALLEETKNANIKIYNDFDPFKLYGNTYRMHDKLVLIDKKYLFVGGRNIMNSYFGQDNDPLPFLTEGEILRLVWNIVTGFGVWDLAMMAYNRELKEINHNRQFKDRDVLVTGSAVQAARNYFFDRFYRDKRVTEKHLGSHAVTKEDFKYYKNFVNCKKQQREESCLKQKILLKAKDLYNFCKATHSTTVRECRKVVHRFKQEAKKAYFEIENILEQNKDIKKNQTQRIRELAHRFVQVDEVHFLHQMTENMQRQKSKKSGMNIAKAILQMISTAEKRVWYTTPYLVPSKEMYKAVEQAHYNNTKMDMRILTNSLLTTDVNIIHSGYTKHRPKMLDKGIDLHEYESSKILHSKTGIFDHEWSFVGSYNLDQRAQNLNSEVGVLIRSKEINQRLENYMKQDFESSIPVEEGVGVQAELRKEVHPFKKIEYALWRSILFLIPPLETQF